MDIVCPKCSTEYEFEDDKVTSSGITVKCTTCEHTFKVKRKEVVETEELDSIDADDRPWQIRTPDGALMRFRELTTLQQWIVERKVDREAQISRSGDTWKRLGDIAELSSFFQVVDAARAGERLSQLNQRVGSQSYSGEPDSIGSFSAENEPQFSKSSSQLAAYQGGAAWEGQAASFSGREGYEDDYSDELPRRSGAKYAILIIVGILVLGSGIFVAIKPEIVKNLFSSLGGAKAKSPAYKAAYALLLKDDETNLKAADQGFAKLSKENVLAKAARAEVFAVWAQHLIDQAELIDQRISLLDQRANKLLTDKPEKGKKVKKKNIAAEAKALNDKTKVLRLQAGKLREDAEKKIASAEALLNDELVKKSKAFEVLRAIADVHRLKSKDIKAELENAVKLNGDDPELKYIQSLFWRKKDASRSINLIKAAILKSKSFTKKPLLRASMQLALMHYRAGRQTEARQQVDMILATNPNHNWAQSLISEISDAKKVESKDQEIKPSNDNVKNDPKEVVSKPAANNDKKDDKPIVKKPDPKLLDYGSLIKAGDRLAEYGKSAAAMGKYEAALKQNPQGVAALVGMGYCQLDIQRFSAALSYFRKALKLSPTHGEAMIGMADTYRALGNKQNALNYYKAYVKTYPAMRKANIARRNIQEIERQLGKNKPTPVAPTPSTPKSSAPTPSAPTPSAPTPSAPDTSSGKLKVNLPD